MGWQLTESVADHATATADFLGARPAENTISLTVIENALVSEVAGARYAWWCDAEGAVCGAASMTPPYALLLAAPPTAAVGELVGVMRATGWSTTGVNGTPDAAAAFADAWRPGGARQLLVELLLHRLGTLRPPDPLPIGRGRPATTADLPAIIDWWDAFGRETGTSHGADAAGTATDRLRGGQVTVWEVDLPVAMAARSRPAAGVVRIGPVYTVPEQRCRGYGAAVTAAATAAALSVAPEVVLFTDAANPTSNAIYRRLGYQPVGKRVELGWAS